MGSERVEKNTDQKMEKFISVRLSTELFEKLNKIKNRGYGRSYSDVIRRLIDEKFKELKMKENLEFIQKFRRTILDSKLPPDVKLELISQLESIENDVLLEGNKSTILIELANSILYLQQYSNNIVDKDKKMYIMSIIRKLKKLRKDFEKKLIEDEG